jgi:hypothetical protein
LLAPLLARAVCFDKRRMCELLLHWGVPWLYWLRVNRAAVPVAHNCAGITDPSAAACLVLATSLLR